MMKRKNLALLVAAVLLLSVAGTTVMAADFSDVSENAYYASAVDWAVQSGITNGTGDGKFSPDKVCSRAEVMTFLWRACLEPQPKSAANPFTDVKSGAYYEKAVLWAVEQGITNGTTATTFSPDQECTYAQILTFLWRANGSPVSGGTTYMTKDWPDSLYYKPAVVWADENAMLEDEGGEFDPDLPCTRARTVAWLYRDATVYVNTVEELMAAIRPGRQILLDGGTYNLTEWANSVMMDGGEGTGNDYVELAYDDGWEVQIHGVRNLSIQKGNTFDTELPKIVVEPRRVNVLSFYDCDDVYLGELTMGHTPEQGYCTGGVLYFKDCGSVAMSGMDLYGCGTYGIIADTVESIQTVDSVIHDCSYGLLDLTAVKDAGFGGVVFRNSSGYDMLNFYKGTNVSFKDCTFENNTWSEYSEFIEADPSCTASFDSCNFDNAAYDSIVKDAGFGQTIKVTNGTILNGVE